MNKLFNKIAVSCLGAAMAIGAGFAASNKNSKAAKVEAAYSNSMATSIDSGSKYLIGVTDSDDDKLYSLIPANVTTTQTNPAKTETNLSTAPQSYAWTIATATISNKTGYTISCLVDTTTYYLYLAGSGSKKLKYVTSNNLSLNALFDITYNSSTNWTIATKTEEVYYLEYYNSADFRPYKTYDQANPEMELYLWNDEQSTDYIDTLTPANESITINAGTILTSQVIGSVTASGSETINNYTNYAAELGYYNNETYTKRSNITLGTTYVSYNGNYNVIKLTATDWPTEPNGQTYASVMIPLTINNIASSSFKIALSTASTTEVTTREIQEGASETLVIFGYTSGTNPSVEWSVSPSGVVSVNESGVVSALAVGTATVTATSSVNNANGVKTTASVSYTIQAGPAYSLYFNGTNTGFGDVTGSTTPGAGVTTADYTRTYGVLDWTLETVSAEDTNVRITEATDKNTYIQIGVTNYPATSFFLRSSVFGYAKTKVTSVTVKVSGAADTSSATLSVLADEGTFKKGSDSSVTFTGTTERVYEFTSTAAYGHLKINFASVTKGIRIHYIVIAAGADSTNKGQAYAFASKLEPVDTCSADGKSALISEYNSLSPEVKALADVINLFDRPSSQDEDYGETYKTKTVTVAQKMAYIIAIHGGSNPNNLRNMETSGALSNVSIIIIVVSVISVVNLGAYFLIRRRREQ